LKEATASAREASRLADTSGRITHSPAWRSRGDGGQWATKRKSQFLRAIESIATNAGSLDELRLAAQEISMFLAEALPASLTSLPRGYSFVANRVGARSLELNGKLFGPAFAESIVGDAEIAQLALDLKTGLMREIEGVFEKAAQL
jgi:hypothetical protein